MAQAKAHLSILSMKPETVYGTDPTGGDELPIISHTLKAVQAQETPETITGLRSAAPPLPLTTSVEGDIVVPLDDTHLQHWLDLMFDPATGFLLATQGSCTIQDLVSTVQKYRYSGCKIVRMGLSFARRQPLRATFGILGASVAASAAAAGTGVTCTPYSLAHLVLKEAGSAIKTITEL